MTLKECYQILKITDSASIDDIKHAYRTRAFELHPDLNPKGSDTTTQFQKLNEAYLILSKFQQHTRTQVTTPEKDKEDKKHTQTTTESNKENISHYTQDEDTDYIKVSFNKQKNTENKQTDTGHKKMDTEYDISQDILNDDFAKNVFEDIFKKILNETSKDTVDMDQSNPTNQPSLIQRIFHRVQQIKVFFKTFFQGQTLQSSTMSHKTPLTFRGWLQGHIDEEQHIELPAHSLLPGAHIRLQIRHGFSKELTTLEFTLPQTFSPIKRLCFKRMGKKLGRWQGDLYLRLIPK